MPRLLLVCASICCLAGVTDAADWPQWMGPNRDGVWSENGVCVEFKTKPPKELWRTAIGGGYAGPAVADGKVYVADKKLKHGVIASPDPFAKRDLPSDERVLCCDAATGKTLWTHTYPVVYAIQYPCGPRCTPLVHDGKVYTLGAMGDLCCLDANAHDNGKAKLIWSKNFPADFGAKVPMWGFSSHPIIHKNLLICLVGGEEGAICAMEKDTGKTVWSAMKCGEPGYNSPILIESGGVTQLVVWMPKHLIGLNPTTGQKYWSVPLEPDFAMSIMSPRKHDDCIFAAGLGNVGVTLKLDGTDPKKVTEVWRANGEPAPKEGAFPVNMTPFIENGTVYAADQPGMFRAFELKTGKRKWESFKPIFGVEKANNFRALYATTFVVKNSENDCFYLFCETGDLAVAKLTPAGYTELGRIHVLEPMCTAQNGRKAVWSHSAFANRSMYARNDKHLICVPLTK